MSRPVARLLVVHHTPSPVMQRLLEAVLDGARQVDGVEVQAEPALSATASDVLAADAVALGTPANIGYLSGAMKHFFDVVYYPVLEARRGLPYGLWVHGGDDVEGAVRAAERITGGMGWRQIAAHVRVTGAPTGDDVQACGELGGVLALTAAGSA